jgi:hypothetical protein
LEVSRAEGEEVFLSVHAPMYNGEEIVSNEAATRHGIPGNSRSLEVKANCNIEPNF